MRFDRRPSPVQALLAGVVLAGMLFPILVAPAVTRAGEAVSGDGRTAANETTLVDLKRQLSQERSWRDNLDDAWFEANIPRFDCPDREVVTTWLYRHELMTKHMTYGSPEWGYCFTEFIDRPFWSGAYGAISCPAGHQFDDLRWWRDPRYVRDYARYWYRHPGAQPRNYSTWLADAVIGTHRVHPDRDFLVSLLSDMVRNHEGWEKRHFVPTEGMFWQTGHDDGMEFNINSRQTADILRGAPGYRPTFNSYMIADARAIAEVAELAGDRSLAERFRGKAEALRKRMNERLWDPKRGFYFPRFRDREQRDGHVVAAGSLTYETGQHAGSEFGRELIGYVPWQFGLADPGREEAWRPLLRDDGFLSPFGPTTVEKRDPMFLLKPTCCWWSGQSWPYATSQTLTAMAMLLDRYGQRVVSKADWFKLFRIYTLTHRKNGRPYLAEAAHPETGSFEGHDGANHSEHYFHSSYINLVVTGLVGLRPRADDIVEIHPLAPDWWDWWCLEAVPYQGRDLTIVWDRDGSKFGRGAGLTIRCGTEKANSPKLGRLTMKLPPIESGRAVASAADPRRSRRVNFAVNNDGESFPRLKASFTAERTSLAALNDGNHWYHKVPTNRWSAEASGNPRDVITCDFGTPRTIDELRLMFLDDGEGIVPPASFSVEMLVDGSWQTPDRAARMPVTPTGRMANRVTFAARAASAVRVTFEHGRGWTGLSEFEAWGDAVGPVPGAPPPAGNLALARPGQPFPKASASFTSPYDRPDRVLDGKVIHRMEPNSRWTAYESPNSEDWLRIDLGQPTRLTRAVLHLYDDRGGVQRPESIRIETLADDGSWKSVVGLRLDPAKPRGGMPNEATFAPVTSSAIRFVFRHSGRSRSGVTEVELYGE